MNFLFISSRNISKNGLITEVADFSYLFTSSQLQKIDAYTFVKQDNQSNASINLKSLLSIIKNKVIYLVTYHYESLLRCLLSECERQECELPKFKIIDLSLLGEIKLGLIRRPSLSYLSRRLFSEIGEDNISSEKQIYMMKRILKRFLTTNFMGELQNNPPYLIMSEEVSELILRRKKRKVRSLSEIDNLIEHTYSRLIFLAFKENSKEKVIESLTYAITDYNLNIIQLVNKNFNDKQLEEYLDNLTFLLTQKYALIILLDGEEDVALLSRSYQKYGLSLMDFRLLDLKFLHKKKNRLNITFKKFIDENASLEANLKNEILYLKNNYNKQGFLDYELGDALTFSKDVLERKKDQLKRQNILNCCLIEMKKLSPLKKKFQTFRMLYDHDEQYRKTLLLSDCIGRRFTLSNQVQENFPDSIDLIKKLQTLGYLFSPDSRTSDIFLCYDEDDKNKMSSLIKREIKPRFVLVDNAYLLEKKF